VAGGLGVRRTTTVLGVAVAIAVAATAAGGVLARQQRPGTAAAHLSARGTPLAQRPQAQPPSPSYRVVTLGDSVTAGSACTCAAFPEVYGQRLAARTAKPVHVRNEGVPGETSGALLRSLQGATARAVGNADVVTVTIGANDFSFDTFRRNPCRALACYRTGLGRLHDNLTATFAAIHRVQRGARQVVLVTGYWDIWRDGVVGRGIGATYMNVGIALTQRVNTVIAATAAAASFRYVDLYAPFRGRSGARDDSDLLADDGDHPNAAGHRLIAAELIRQGGRAAATP
jgi:lysophospholipase L1-like esterase